MTRGARNRQGALSGRPRAPRSRRRHDRALLGSVLGKAGSRRSGGNARLLLSGRTHEVVSGLCLCTDEWEEVGCEVTSVTFRSRSPPEIERYVASGEWRERAGAYAIQGLGASLVERIDGDYQNVVGLPAALLVRLLAERFPGVYGFG